MKSGGLLTAAGDVGWRDLLGTQGGHLREGVGDAHLLGRARHVDGHTVPHLQPGLRLLGFSVRV